MNSLTQVGTKYRLTLENGNTVTLEDAQKVIDHLNRFDMVRNTSGIEILPDFFQNQLSYSGYAPKNYVCNNCKQEFDEFKTIGHEESECMICPICNSDDFTTNLKR